MTNPTGSHQCVFYYTSWWHGCLLECGYVRCASLDDLKLLSCFQVVCAGTTLGIRSGNDGKLLYSRSEQSSPGVKHPSIQQVAGAMNCSEFRPHGSSFFVLPVLVISHIFVSESCFLGSTTKTCFSGFVIAHTFPSCLLQSDRDLATNLCVKGVA